MLVHCSDGWDRTSQLSALMQILIDPYYRTIEGFEVLIEKEFVYSGHQFAQRLGFGIENVFDFSDFCPVLLQFLDCIWQIMDQFPTAFEFNDLFLREIAYHSFSSRFGTFLCNSERQRESINLRTSTVSLWSYINSQIEKYKNILFNNSSNILVPDDNIMRLKVWNSLYMQWVRKESEGRRDIEKLIKKKKKEEDENELRLKEKKETLDKLEEKIKELNLN